MNLANELYRKSLHFLLILIPIFFCTFGKWKTLAIIAPISLVFLAACINFLVFKKEIAVTSFSILIISDGLSAIVGKSISSQPFFEKTRAGALAFFISALAVLAVCGAAFHVHLWFYFFGIFSIFCVTMIEARPSLLDIDDNFSIPMAFSFLMTGFDFMWG